jgi:exonuclease III
MNPGPNNNFFRFNNKNNMFILSYNIRGCKNFQKLKRISKFFLTTPFKKNCIINLQETHLNKEEINKIEYQWKFGSIQSPAINNSGGVAILYDSSYFNDIIEKRSHSNGRICSLLAKKEEETFFYVNIYAPNDNQLMELFIEELDEYIWQTLDLHPDANLIISGDFNIVINQSIDSVNRNQTVAESRVKDNLLNLLNRLYLNDSYRSLHEYGGFTWGRDNPKYIRSRLDMIFVKKSLTQNILSAETYLQPNESDHKLLVVELDIGRIDFGPGIIRANSTLLDDPEIKVKIKSKILEAIKDSSFMNPNNRLDFVKMTIRNELLKEGKSVKNKENTILYHANNELDRLNSLLDNSLREHDLKKCRVHSDTCYSEIDKIKEAILIASKDIEVIKEKEAERLIFRSKAKWSEKGEKSNRYFLNLLKERQRKMQIRKIISNGIIHHKSDEITKAIRDFYKNLYDNQQVKDLDDSEMFSNLPKLDDTDREELSKDLTLEELKENLDSCSESAPGIDGITYKIYKQFWSELGPLILQSWNFSTSSGKLSETQRTSVITLLEKKGKDPSKIENLRPISLSTCDVKLCTKAIASRTNKILHKLINVTQTGYVPTRQVQDNNRYLEELIEHYKKENKLAYLITLDAQKAFDSVDHSYLISLLKLYRFPYKYIHWVKTVYTDLKATVLVNGYFSEKIEIKQSVKQGDALSCALFILSIEPLLNSLRNNKNIKKVSTSANRVGESEQVGNDEVNNFSFADDITAICENKTGIQEIINTYNTFSSYSGIKLNIPKTEIMIIGKKTNAKETFIIDSNNQRHTIVDQESVKICGITFSNNTEIAYKENVLNKIVKLERQLNIWRQRNLTLKGKILIVKTFGISQLIYSMQATNFREKEIKEIEKIIFKFIWNIKPSSKCNNGKISRSTLKGPLSRGGLNAPDIESLNEAIKYKCLLRNLTSNHPIGSLVKNMLNLTENKILPFHCKIPVGSISAFYDKAIKSHTKFGKIIEEDISSLRNEKSNINIGYAKYLQNLNLTDVNFFSKDQKSLIIHLRKKKITTLKDIIRVHFKEKSNISFFSHQLFHSIPKFIVSYLKDCKREHEPNHDYVLPYKENLWSQSSKVTTKQIRQRLFDTQHKQHLNIHVYLRDKHKLLHTTYINTNPFLDINTVTKETKLQDVQFKILHNIYPTLRHLYKYKIKDNDKCPSCLVTDDLKHTIFDCSIVKQTWQNFVTILNTTYKINIPDLTYETILFGFKKQTTDSYKALSTILIIIKRKVILQRENKVSLTRDDINNIIRSQIRLEKRISLKTDFDKKWCLLNGNQ